MSIPALPSSLAAPPLFGASAPASAARPAPESHAVQETRTAAAPAAGETGERSQVEKARKADEAEKDEQASKKELEEAAAKLNEKLKPFINEAVRFKVDQDSGRLVVAVVDTEKNTVIRQIQSQEALKLSRETDSGSKQQPGLLLNTQA